MGVQDVMLPVVNPAELRSESDVEQKLILPLLAHGGFLGYPTLWVKTKSYLSPTTIDKGAGRKIGYVPDYSIWHLGFPLLIIEAKRPDESAEEGLREARLYSMEINKRYPPDINPVAYIVACNGRRLLVSHWDSEDVIALNVEDLAPGTQATEALRALISKAALIELAQALSNSIRREKTFTPAAYMGGPDVLNTPLGLNSFSDDLLPLIERYFGVEGQENVREIVRKAYVSSDEITRYEATLEAYLRDKVVQLSREELQPLETTRAGEPRLTKLISQYSTNPAFFGRLQLLIGAVGSGKTAFINRYFYHLMPETLRAKTLLAFVDFNNAPSDLSDLETWICRTFVQSFAETNDLGSIYDLKNLKRIFAPEINKRERGPYAVIKAKQPDEYERRISTDLTNWTDDSKIFAENLARYYIGDQRKAVVVVLDNADKLERSQQLRVFEASQWFKNLTKSFCILALRDVTYEGFKALPPLDAFANAANFYITPPRFTDVVRKRLLLAIDYLTENSENKLSYALPNGMRVSYPATDLGKYLLTLYVTLFHHRTQVAGAIEALTGRDIRRALRMFADLIVSKHLSEVDITKIIRQVDNFDISEATIIKILMRTRYKYFSEEHGYVYNIFDIPTGCERPTNFLLIEILEFLASHRTVQGDIRLQGYFTVETVISAMDKLGFVEDDVLLAVNWLAERRLIVTDHQLPKIKSPEDAVRIHASGFIHLRFFSGRFEYLTAVLPATRVFSEAFAKAVANTWVIPPDRADISSPSKLRLLTSFREYLRREYDGRARRHPYFDEHAVGSRRVLKRIDKAYEFMTSPYTPKNRRDSDLEDDQGKLI